jgi:hypothetical protein
LAIALWAVGLYLLVFIASLAAFVVLIILLPARYFVEEPNWLLANQRPWLRWLAIIGKNLLGVAIILLGIGLSLPGIPGQGILTILIGAMLLDIPGKRRLARSLVRRPSVLRPINRLRSWFGRPPLVLD